MDILANFICRRNQYKCTKHNYPLVQKSPWPRLVDSWRCFGEAWWCVSPVLNKFPLYSPLFTIITAHNAVWAFGQMQQLLCHLFGLALFIFWVLLWGKWFFYHESNQVRKLTVWIFVRCWHNWDDKQYGSPGR